MFVKITCDGDEIEDSVESGSYSQKVETKEGNKREEENERRTWSNLLIGGADRHLIDTERCPCHGQMYSTGSRTGRQSVLQWRPLKRPLSLQCFPILTVVS